MALSPFISLLALSFAGISLGQSTTETVWASFAYVLYGERTPVLGESPVTLTPLGAQQLYSQGSLFRARYLSNSSLSDEDNRITTNSAIVGLEKDVIDNNQISIYSTPDDFVTGSTLAFMQGLYPPVAGSSDASTLANGTTIEYPLNGYQYPNIQTLSGLDPNSIWLAGHSGCSEYWSSGNAFTGEAYARQLYNASLAFYQTTWAEVFPDALSASTVNFNHAYDLYEYAQFAYAHNQTARAALNDARLARLRTLADDQQFALNGDLSASGRESGDRIRAVAGRTLAGRVVAQLSTHIASAGTSDKLTLAFGSFEPFLAFFSLAGLAESDDNGSAVLFRQVPQPGAAMVFELLSTNNDTSPYPSSSDLRVRFLYRNGTDPDAPLEEYPLFGSSSGSRLPWSSFRERMGAFAIKDIAGWCRACGAITLFCIALDSSSSGSPPSGTLFGGDGGGSPSPAVAGVIGALTALAVVGAGAASAFVLGGVRVRRCGAGHRRSSSLGGFKGAEKMASDRDVSVVRGGARHARVGSWELGGPGPVPVGGESGLPPKQDAAFFGASVHEKADGDDDVDSIIGRAPVKPLESI
ncbi:histidine phosphatase superfamily [Camillea tinctor]|nr:histidine phosphatase superfamily [Camillea tinctor]